MLHFALTVPQYLIYIEQRLASLDDIILLIIYYMYTPEVQGVILFLSLNSPISKWDPSRHE